MELLDQHGYSIPEAAAWIGIGRTMTYDLLAAGRLESMKIGNRRIIPGWAIRKFMALAS